MNFASNACAIPFKLLLARLGVKCKQILDLKGASDTEVCDTIRSVSNYRRLCFPRTAEQRRVCSQCV
jgi:hypothetical protein